MAQRRSEWFVMGGVTTERRWDIFDKLNIANFNFVLGEYHIHVYAVNTDGQQYVLGEGMGSVQ